PTPHGQHPPEGALGAQVKPREPAGETREWSPAEPWSGLPASDRTGDRRTGRRTARDDAPARPGLRCATYLHSAVRIDRVFSNSKKTSWSPGIVSPRSAGVRSRPGSGGREGTRSFR